MPVRHAQSLPESPLKPSDTGIRPGTSLFLRPMMAAMRWVLRYPGLSDRINRRLRAFPRLHRLLLRVAYLGGVMVGTTPDGRRAARDRAGAVDVTTLTPRARQIHERLQAAMRRQHARED
jgi:hypothetical protein